MRTLGSGDFLSGSPQSAANSRSRVRYAASMICGGVAAFYLIYFFVVRAREMAVVPHQESMAPVYLMAAILFLIGAVLLATVDRRGLWVVGAGVQVIVVGLYLWNGVHGVWNDTPWAIVISATESALFGLLVFLARGRPSGVGTPVP
jgi:hypothetical protein